jgi:hypothetical protein
VAYLKMAPEHSYLRTDPKPVKSEGLKCRGVLECVLRCGNDT